MNKMRNTKFFIIFRFNIIFILIRLEISLVTFSKYKIQIIYLTRIYYCNYNLIIVILDTEDSSKFLKIKIKTHKENI